MEDGYVLPPGADNVDEQQELPPGFRFHPTDEELVTYYLARKASDHGFSAGAIGEVDLNKCEPWDLPWRGAKMREKEWYFFCVRDRKYPAGQRTNRTTDSGYWKATGKDKEVRRGKSLVGRRKTLVFYGGRAPKGERTGWIMHEYRLDGNLSLYNKAAKNEWVICRVFQKGFSSSASAAEATGGGGKEVPGLRARTGSSVGCYRDGVMTAASSAFTSDLLPSLKDLSFRGTGSRIVWAITAPPGAAHVTCFSNAAAGHKSHERVMDCHSSSPVFSASAYNNPRSSVSRSTLSLGKLSGEAGMMQLLQNHGYVVEDGISEGKAEGEVGRGTSQETAMYLAGSSPSLLLSSHEVISGQKVPSGTVPLGDCISWNY